MSRRRVVPALCGTWQGDHSVEYDVLNFRGNTIYIAKSGGSTQGWRVSSPTGFSAKLPPCASDSAP